MVDCLEDPDETLKRKTLDLLFRMTNATNVVFVVDKLIYHLKSTTDVQFRGSLTERLTQLAERYAPDNSWYIRTMNAVFEVHACMRRTHPQRLAHPAARPGTLLCPLVLALLPAPSPPPRPHAYSPPPFSCWAATCSWVGLHAAPLHCRAGPHAVSPRHTPSHPVTLQLGGDLVRPDVAHNLMRLIAEGSGEDEDADMALRKYAAETYFEILEKTKLPDVLLQVITR